MFMMLLLIDMDFIYQFNLRLIAPLFTVSFHEMFERKKVFQDFQKLAGLWLVGEMDNHVGIYGSKVAEGFSALQRQSCLHLWSDMLIILICDSITHENHLQIASLITKKITFHGRRVILPSSSEVTLKYLRKYQNHYIYFFFQ